MTTLALVHPTSLLASELRDALDGRRGELWDHAVLLSDVESEIGTLTEVGGTAAVVSALDGDSFSGVDAAFFFGARAAYGDALAAAPEGTTRIVVGTDGEEHAGTPVVAGVNLDAAERGAIVQSPHPSVVALAHLLHPLRDFGVGDIAATLLQPVSTLGKPALDAMFEQTRSLLAFQPVDTKLLGAQLAFNVLDGGEGTAHLLPPLRAVLGRDDLRASLQVLRAGVFHSLGVSLHVTLGDDPGAAAVRDALTDHPFVDPAPDPEMLGVTDAASRDEVIVGRVETDGGGVYRIWAVMDNITCGGAGNALAILEALHGKARA